jgi:hypothetical protein
LWFRKKQGSDFIYFFRSEGSWSFIACLHSMRWSEVLVKCMTSLLWSFMKFRFFGEVKWKLVKSNTVHRGGPEVSKKNLLNSIQSHGHLSQVHIEELLQSKPFLPIRQLPPSQSCGDHHLWSILHNPRHMASSCADNSPNTSYPPRGLRPWDTWVKESRNVFFPHIPYRYAGTQNRGRVAGMMHSCQEGKEQKYNFFLIFFSLRKN